MELNVFLSAANIVSGPHLLLSEQTLINKLNKYLINRILNSHPLNHTQRVPIIKPANRLVILVLMNLIFFFRNIIRILYFQSLNYEFFFIKHARLWVNIYYTLLKNCIQNSKLKLRYFTTMLMWSKVDLVCCVVIRASIELYLSSVTGSLPHPCHPLLNSDMDFTFNINHFTK